MFYVAWPKCTFVWSHHFILLLCVHMGIHIKIYTSITLLILTVRSLVELKYVSAKIKAFKSRSRYHLKVGQAIFTIPVGQALALPIIKIFKSLLYSTLEKLTRIHKILLCKYFA